jgi:demethylmenaquinone methyltransferase/2-methoxy-6-polyprenyl-1,4-benzoquinol methylase
MSVAMSRSRPDEFARSLFARLPPRYDQLGWLLSFGQDRRWRTAAVGRVVGDEPALVLDVATGTAGVARQLVERGAGHVVGVDLSEPMVREGAVAVGRAALGSSIQLVLGRAEELPFPDASFDALSFSYLLRYVADPAATLAELARVVKPGGRVAGFDFAVPDRAVWRGLWWCYTRAVLPIAGWCAGGRAWFDVGRFLGPSISEHEARFPPAWTIDAWNAAGFADVASRSMSLGGARVTWGRRS